MVMKDGAVVADHPVAGLDRDDLVWLMDGGATGPEPSATIRGRPTHTESQLVTIQLDDSPTVIQVRPGEVVGFGGLDGHGQREMIRRIYRQDAKRKGADTSPKDIGFVSGDRAREGIFPSWSIAKNLSVRGLSKVSRFGIISRGAEAGLVSTWLARLSVRLNVTTSLMSSLSGGNQQKVLIGRALSSDAPLILLDDPTRGVDQRTKLEFYKILDAEAAGGRAFIWYATEFEELRLCDRVYVFYMNRITDESDGAELSEARVLRSSFAGLEVR